MTRPFNPFAPRHWPLAHGKSLTIGPRAVVMGVLNVTPDSFSDGGDYVDPAVAVSRARGMMTAGAAIIDIGGESTRPGANLVNGEAERARVLPIIKQLANETDAIISIDTYRTGTAAAAIEAGAHIINDVWGLQQESGIANVAAETGAGLVVMHTGRERDVLPGVIEDQIGFLEKSLQIAEKVGTSTDSIVLDPGFGFAKDANHNLELLNRLGELHTLRHPLLVGTSRKRFLGTITGREPHERGAATAATSVVAREKGAAIFRVHDIAMNVDALAVADALLERKAKT